MLLTVGGLVASLVLPGQAAPALALTAVAAAVRAVRHVTSPEARARRQARRERVANVAAVPEDVLLEWANITCVLKGKSKHSADRLLLDGVSGVARPGRVFAILGPSGSGKTTLLNCLAGRLPFVKSMELRGVIQSNGVSIDESAHPLAYVTQEDLFFSQLTVFETLEMAARMRLPREMSHEEKAEFATNLIRKLGLVSVMNTNVGDEKTRGISGGERKRLSLGCELISTPRLVLCDEPTSGLDAFQAEKVMQSLRTLAEAGHTVICSIHQPSSAIFKLCDDVMLLADGRVVYAGPTSEARSNFDEFGFPTPPECNPAEFYLELVSVDFASEETVAKSRKRINDLVLGFSRSSAAAAAGALGKARTSTPPTGSAVAVPTCSLGPLGQVRVLLQRAWRQITRDKKTNMSRFMSSFMSALLFGAIYWRIGKTQSTIQDRLGLLQVCTINAAMTSLVKTLNVFPRESVIVNRERSRGSYGVPEYFVSKLLAEMPVSAFFPLVFSLTVYPMVRLSGGIGRILRFMGIVTLESFTAASYGLAIGALMPSTEAALAVGPASFVLQIVFGGLYVTDENVPRWASWIPRVSLIKHAFEGLCVNELRSLEFETKRPWDVKNGEQVLQRMSWGDSTVFKACVSQARVLAFNYLATFTILTLKKPKFEKLLPAVETEERLIDVDRADVASRETEASAAIEAEASAISA